MAKLKLENNLWKMLWLGLKIYFQNIGQVTKYMLFPVFGQIIGVCLIFGLTAWFTFSIPTLIDKYSILNNIMLVFIIVILLSVPGFVIFIKAFWDYLVAYGSLSSMASAILDTGKLYDLNAHTQLITKRTFKYMCLLLVISILALIAINPLFWILAIIFFVYFILVFQVFTFEEDASVFDCFKRSLNLVKGNFARTFILMIILGIISNVILNSALGILFDFSRLSDVLLRVFEAWTVTLPIEDVNITLTSFRLPLITTLMISKHLLAGLILFIVTGLTLPMRSFCWTVWYKSLKDSKVDKK